MHQQVNNKLSSSTLFYLDNASSVCVCVCVFERAAVKVKCLDATGGHRARFRVIMLGFTLMGPRRSSFFSTDGNSPSSFSIAS